MKKYKHKITGDIVSQTGDRYTLNTTLLPKQWIENSNDWEEIVEEKKQGYQILSFLTIEKFGYPKHTWRVEEDNKFRGVPLEAMLHDGNCVDSGCFEIYSIKRLSDGEVFTIGDIINCQKDQNQILLEIKIYNEKIRFKMEFQKNHDWNSSYTLDFINKPNKLFTTEDGVDIFEGDNLYYVCPDENFIRTITGWKNNINYNHPENKTFSKKENAEEFILINTKCLSISDLNSLIELGGLAHIEKNAKLLVKNRL